MSRCELRRGLEEDFPCDWCHTCRVETDGDVCLCCFEELARSGIAIPADD